MRLCDILQTQLQSISQFIAQYTKMSINANLYILSYNEAMVQNAYVTENFPLVSDKFWLFGCAGQGDEWFLSKSDNSVFYQEHILENFKITILFDMQANFTKFLWFGFLCAELECIEFNASERKLLKKQMRFAKISCRDIRLGCLNKFQKS